MPEPDFGQVQPWRPRTWSLWKQCGSFGVDDHVAGATNTLTGKTVLRWHVVGVRPPPLIRLCWSMKPMLSAIRKNLA
jgi:hypothetical protein